jgi:preprotein translocase subunit SecG
MLTFVTALHIFICVLLVIVVLIQPSRDGGGIGGSFGGSSQTIFGSSGGANFFTKFTSGLAAVFMVTSLFITLAKSGSKKSIFDTNPAAANVEAKAAPAAEAPATAPAAADAPKAE